MKTYRKHIGRFQFIFDAGFNKHDFAIGIDVTYLDGMKIQKHVIEGFWCIRLMLVVLSVTINITDKKENQNYEQFEE